VLKFSQFFFARVMGALPGVKADPRFSDGEYFARSTYLPCVTVRAWTVVLHAYFKLILAVVHGRPSTNSTTGLGSPMMARNDEAAN